MKIPVFDLSNMLVPEVLRLEGFNKEPWSYNATNFIHFTTGFLTRRVRPCVSLSLARVGREGGRVWVNEFILFSTKFQLISIFSYWISNMGDDHHRWFGVNNVHIPCKYIILTNLICFYCYLVDRNGKSMSQMTDMFLIHLS